jgi:predicted acylesterase/phospholipase RssA|uniref:PNPLA domain-containing protein n=1 Tax=Phaeodactylum tricornutum TaxID=2850 RepID=A0A8J9SQ77_PHATR
MRAAPAFTEYLVIGLDPELRKVWYALIVALTYTSKMFEVHRRAVALSLSGAGHLLPYHAGVCQELLNFAKTQGQRVPLEIAALSGSSSGAIVAAVAAFAPSQLESFALDFIQQRGRGLSLLQETLENHQTCQQSDQSTNKQTPMSQGQPALQIYTTQCRSGEPYAFTFSSYSPLLLDAIRASCHVPISFHPVDMISWSPLSLPLTFADSEGVLIHEEAYVDGAIASPAPPTPHQLTRVVVSPISGGVGTLDSDQWRISPHDTSWRIGSVTLKGSFPVRLSTQNLRALRTSVGATSSAELERWYQLGLDDGRRFCEDWEKIGA